MTLLTSGSVIAAFFAGAVALFAPCCIVFLLPSYIAAAVKNRRWRLLPLTFAFALGLAVVLVPITLGVRLLASTLTRYHTPLYAAGGVLLVSLAVLAIAGKSWSLPSFVRAPDPERGDSAGIFALGVFSGIASSCCAPVLAGVMTLSALSSTTAGAALLGLSYVFGMTLPLFVLALVWDRYDLGTRRFMTARTLHLHVGPLRWATNTINIAVAVVFASMGAFVLWLAASGDTTPVPGAQLAVGRGLSRLLTRIERWLEPIPEPILGIGLLALAALFVIAGLRDRTSTPQRSAHVDQASTRESSAGTSSHSCH
ncbi:MAG: cytochrome c biogenesis protein CcdA [Actinobacteria bacterium]|nr:cytochrome c biogenesis protein CcdA [Actinomycetota bacterium]